MNEYATCSEFLPTLLRTLVINVSILIVGLLTCIINCMILVQCIFLLIFRHAIICHAYIFSCCGCAVYILPYIFLLFFFSFRNYNPVERRCKGGKGGNLKSLKSSKSLQTNAMNNSGSGDTLDTNRITGLLLVDFDPQPLCIFPDGFSMLLYFYSHPFLFPFLGFCF